MERNKITKEELAEMLDGGEYGDEITDKETLLAKENGLIVFFTRSDDLLELRGAMYGEEGFGENIIYRGVYGKLVIKHKDVIQEINDFLKEYNLSFNQPFITIIVEEKECYTISTTLPHSTFTIMEDGERYCEGIVLDIKDLQLL